MAETETDNDPRVYFAAVRTVLAWMRTSLAMMGFGFVVARFGLFLREVAALRPGPVHESSGISAWVGVLLMTAGAIAQIVSALQYARYLKRFSNHHPELRGTAPFTIGVALLLGAVGLFLAAYLAAVQR